MIMGADDDATLPETSAGKDHLFTDAYKRRVLPGMGHFIQRERPEVVVEAVVERAQRFYFPR
jgi:pimeloyl-ACP methyl ester carboxylesterase